MKCGHVVQIKTNGFKNISTGDNNIYQLPEAYRPKIDSQWELRDPKNNVYRISIKKDGTISVYGYSISNGTENVSNTLVYIV